MESLNVDTSFLIDFQKEVKANLIGPTRFFLKEKEGVQIYLSVIALGEFAEGFASLADLKYRTVSEYFRVVPTTIKTSEIYSRVSRELRAKGNMIGANDTWIAAAALENGHPLITRNPAHFSRVSGLQVRGY